MKEEWNLRWGQGIPCPYQEVVKNRHPMSKESGWECFQRRFYSLLDTFLGGGRVLSCERDLGVGGQSLAVLEDGDGDSNSIYETKTRWGYN